MMVESIGNLRVVIYFKPVYLQTTQFRWLNPVTSNFFEYLKNLIRVSKTVHEIPVIEIFLGKSYSLINFYSLH